MKVGDKIRKIRNLRGFSQEQLAKKLNITAQAYSALEQNRTKLDIDRLNQIADALGVSVDDIESFDEKTLFINAQKNRDSFIISCSDDKSISVLENVIQQNNEEIAFLRQQIVELTATIKLLSNNK